MLNAALIVILLLHGLPYWIAQDFDLYIVTNIMIQLILSGCLFFKSKGKVQKILCFSVFVVTMYFLCNYINEEIPIEMLKPYTWIYYGQEG